MQTHQACPQLPCVLIDIINLYMGDHTDVENSVRIDESSLPQLPVDLIQIVNLYTAGPLEWKPLVSTLMAEGQGMPSRKRLDPPEAISSGLRYLHIRRFFFFFVRFVVILFCFVGFCWFCWVLFDPLN